MVVIDGLTLLGSSRNYSLSSAKHASLQFDVKGKTNLYKENAKSITYLFLSHLLRYNTQWFVSLLLSKNIVKSCVLVLMRCKYITVGKPHKCSNACKLIGWCGLSCSRNKLTIKLCSMMTSYMTVQPTDWRKCNNKIFLNPWEIRTPFQELFSFTSGHKILYRIIWHRHVCHVVSIIWTVHFKVYTLCLIVILRILSLFYHPVPLLVLFSASLFELFSYSFLLLFVSSLSRDCLLLM